MPSNTRDPALDTAASPLQSKGPYDGMEIWEKTSARLIECAAAGTGVGYSYPSYNGRQLLKGSFVLSGRLAWLAEEASHLILTHNTVKYMQMSGFAMSDLELPLF